MMNSHELILASSSPRRSELLKRLGVQFSVKAPSINENQREGESPDALVVRLARMKVQAVLHDRPRAVVIAADTVVALDNQIFNKPRDPVEALSFLRALNGRVHEVYTGLAVADANLLRQQCICTRVHFGYFSDDALKAYVATAEGRDKAGAYAIQGIGGFLVENIEGSASSVVGMPLYETTQMLASFGIPLFKYN